MSRTPGNFAADTSISVARSRADIEDLVGRAGADQFGSIAEAGRACIMFRIPGKGGQKISVRIVLPVPDVTSKEFTHRVVRGMAKSNTVEESRKRWEQACRSRWRTLHLVIKAKLEAIALNISTVEREFLADVMMPNGQTVGDEVIEQLPAMATQGLGIRLLGSGKKEGNL